MTTSHNPADDATRGLDPRVISAKNLKLPPFSSSTEPLYHQLAPKKPVVQMTISHGNSNVFMVPSLHLTFSCLKKG